MRPLALCALAALLHVPMALALETETHRFDEVAPGVFFAVGTGSVYVQSNALVIVSERDVIVVDSHVTPEAARALLASIRALTDKPVRYLINTHYHFDHAHGNQAFPPGVSIVGHAYTRARLGGDVLNEPTYQTFLSALPRDVARLEEAARTHAERAERMRLQAEARVMRAHLQAMAEVRPVPPDMTLQQKLTLHRGERAIEVLFLGRGHTGGDVVVFLPRERLVFTGDLLLPFPSYMGDGFVDEWIETLERLEQLDFDRVLPGHGEAFRDRAPFAAQKGLLRALWQAVAAARAQGLTPEQAAEQIDLNALAEGYADPPLAAFEPQLARAIHLGQIRRIYQLQGERE